ncbi:MAG: hypothetical protein CMG46_07530 [Candidatus Marinimicrobia bacterium]|nr:hypothetical protein [Candidatus Neomarinimicrobiota bacterium]|tara:strand:- start:62 stop:466 length:405 start_codon:yes stop_codon:yes gene_type:complete
MSTAHVANAGIVSGAIRVAQRLPLATIQANVEPVSGAFAAPARDQTELLYDDGYEIGMRRRIASYGPFQDRVVSFGGVLVSHEVGTAIMNAQAAAAVRVSLPLAVEAERNVAVYESNQALMGTAQVVTEIGLRR